MMTVYDNAIKLIKGYNNDPLNFFRQVNKEKRISRHTAFVNQKSRDNLTKELSKQFLFELEKIIQRVDSVNKTAAEDILKPSIIGDSGVTNIKAPISRVGLYVPKKMPSSAFTYLSAMEAAGVKEKIVYIAQDKDGNPDPLSLWVALKYNATILCGPARLAFPVLSFGYQSEKKCDLICGPCGVQLNILKQLSAILNNTTADMSSGPSDVTIVTDNNPDWDMIYFDLISQLEHGDDSTSNLILKGEKAKKHFENHSIYSRLNTQNSVKIYFTLSTAETNRVLSETAPETTIIYSDAPEQYRDGIIYSGVVYHNLSSTLGDYGVIGRGCADPTGGFARAQSGISPGTFIRTVPVISNCNILNHHLETAINLAEYENLTNHKNVLEHFRSKRL